MTYPDEIDRASHLEEMERQHALDGVRRAASQALNPTGACHFCEDVVGDTDNFCDTECRDLYQREQDARRRNGT